MGKRAVLFVGILFLILLAASGCDKIALLFTRPSPTATVSLAPRTPSPTVALVAQPTEVKPTATVKPSATSSPAPTATFTPAGPSAPRLLEPPDGASGSVLELHWQWERPLGEDEWFEVQIWPDTPGAQPAVFGWTQEISWRITSANLLPQAYRWRVVVVQGRDEKRGKELSPYSEEWGFILVRPSTKGMISITPPPMPSPTPTATRTKTPIFPPRPTGSPQPTHTRTPTSVPQPTATASATPVPPTATQTPGGYPVPTATNTPAAPTATYTPGGYPVPTATNTPAPKFSPVPG